jgi:hypothetical protein
MGICLSGVDPSTVDVSFWNRRRYDLKGGDVIMRLWETTNDKTCFVLSGATPGPMFNFILIFRASYDR